MGITSVSVTLPNPASFHGQYKDTGGSPWDRGAPAGTRVYMLSIGGFFANFVTTAV
jgi:hypothetical protein